MVTVTRRLLTPSLHWQLFYRALTPPHDALFFVLSLTPLATLLPSFAPPLFETKSGVSSTFCLKRWRLATLPPSFAPPHDALFFFSFFFSLHWHLFDRALLPPPTQLFFSPVAPFGRRPPQRPYPPHAIRFEYALKDAHGSTEEPPPHLVIDHPLVLIGRERAELPHHGHELLVSRVERELEGLELAALLAPAQLERRPVRLRVAHHRRELRLAHAQLATRLCSRRGTGEKCFSSTKGCSTRSVTCGRNGKRAGRRKPVRDVSLARKKEGAALAV